MFKIKNSTTDNLDFDYDKLNWVRKIQRKYKRYKISAYASELAFYINLCLKYEPDDERDSIDIMYEDITDEFLFTDYEIRKIKKTAIKILKHEYGIIIDNKGRCKK